MALTLGSKLFEISYPYKVHIFWDDHISRIVWRYKVISKQCTAVGDFFQIFWPSHNIWTLICWYIFCLFFLIGQHSILRADYYTIKKSQKVKYHTTWHQGINFHAIMIMNNIFPTYCDKNMEQAKTFRKIKKWYFVTKIVLTYCEKKLF